MFDTLLREVMQRFGIGDKAGPLLSMLLSLVFKETNGGLGGFLDKFKSAGLGDIASSWLGGGAAAKDLSTDQLTRVLGGDAISGMASKLGLASGPIGGALAFMLPKVVGMLTPGGSVPSGIPASVSGLLSGVGGVGSAIGSAASSTAAVAASGGSTLWRWISWIVAALVLLFFWRQCSQTPTPPAAPTQSAPPAAAPAPKAEAPKPVAVPTIALPTSIYFETGKSELADDAKKKIAGVAEQLKANASMKVALTGFTDKTGDPQQNENLSKARAAAVRDALKGDGVAEDRILMQKPEFSTGSGNDAEARRVEIKVAN